MSEANLKPCPFCGSSNVRLHEGDYDQHNNYAVSCGECYGSGPYEPTCVEAAAAWNARATETDQLSALESRVAFLNSWLESMGLPADWTGRLDMWAQVVTSADGQNVRGYCHADWTFADIEREFGRSRTWNLIRWDRATPEQREAARRMR